MAIGDLQGIAQAVRDGEYLFLVLIILGFVAFLFARQYYKRFCALLERRFKQIDLIYQLQLELAEITELDLDAHRDIVSHRDLLDALKAWREDQEKKLDAWLAGLEERCTIADCPHRAAMSIRAEQFTRHVEQLSKQMEKIANDNKELGNEFVAFAGALLDIIARRNGTKT